MIAAKEEYGYTETEKTEAVLKNEKCIIEFDAERKKISGLDLTDPHNEPAFFSKSKRGIAKAWDVLKEKFNENTRMYDICGMLHEAKINTHCWCRMD